MKPDPRPLDTATGLPPRLPGLDDPDAGQGPRFHLFDTTGGDLSDFAPPIDDQRAPRGDR